MDNLPFFSNDGIEALLQKLKEKHYSTAHERNNLLLDLIRAKQPISIYNLHKLSGLSYNTCKQVVKWFEASDLVFSKIASGDNGLPVKLIFIQGADNDKN